jgi:hypothetical protein
VGDGHDQVRDVLGQGYHVAHQSVGLVGDGNHGASIARRWPLGEVREADLHLPPRTADYPCAALPLCSIPGPCATSAVALGRCSMPNSGHHRAGGSGRRR